MTKQSNLPSQSPPNSSDRLKKKKKVLMFKRELRWLNEIESPPLLKQTTRNRANTNTDIKLLSDVNSNSHQNNNKNVGEFKNNTAENSSLPFRLLEHLTIGSSIWNSTVVI